MSKALLRRILLAAGLILLAGRGLAVTPGSVSYTYDGIGRLVAAIYEDGTGQVYTYDPAGNRQTSFSGTPTVLGINATLSVTEGNNLTLTVTRAQNAVATSVNYKTADLTAVSGVNYTATSGTLSFLATDTAKTITVATLNDNKYDGPLTFKVTLTPANSNVALSPATCIVTINEASAAPSFALAAGSTVAEQGAQTFTVTRTGTTSLSQAISYSTADGTAAAGLDYDNTYGTLSFATTDTSKTFQVPSFRRAYYEGTRTYTAKISSPTNGATLGTSTATGTITDPDTAISFAINSPATVTEGNPITFTINENAGPPGIPFTVNYATADGTAVAGTDYTATSGTLSFPLGTTSQTVTVPTLDNRSDSNLRTFTMTLSGASNSAPIGTASGTGSIQAIAVPNAPTLSPAYTYTTSGSYTLTWNNPGNTTSYQLWDVTSTPTQVYSGTALSWSKTQTQSNFWYYEVKACNANGCSAYSNQAEVDFCKNGNC